jgi:hypothetical protein
MNKVEYRLIRHFIAWMIDNARTLDRAGQIAQAKELRRLARERKARHQSHVTALYEAGRQVLAR